MISQSCVQQVGRRPRKRRAKVLGYAAVAEAHNDDDDEDRGADDMTDLLTTGDAARHLGVSPQYLTNLRCWGTGPAWLRVGARGVRYVRADLDHWNALRAGSRTVKV